MYSASFISVLFVIFIDMFGVGLVFPLLSAMLFNPDYPMLPATMPDATRGIWFGILLIIFPLCEFFSAPLWGAASDQYGRRPLLIGSLTLGLFGYLIAVYGALHADLNVFILSRVIEGLAAGNISIAQAAIADLSSPAQKAKHFGLLSTAIGLGFTLGPFFSGLLADYGYHTPFVLTSILILANLLFVSLCFKETLTTFNKRRRLSLLVGLEQLIKAFRLRGMRLIFIGAFFHCLGWSYFFEFVPVYLMKTHGFNTKMVGIFYGVSGALYSLSTGWLIRPFLNAYRPFPLFAIGNLLGGACIFLILVTTSFWLWPLLFPLFFFLAFCWPTATAYVSNNTSKEIQGEALGSLSSINAAAMFICPLFAGYLVGTKPALTIFVGAITMLVAGLLVLIGSAWPPKQHSSF